MLTLPDSTMFFTAFLYLSFNSGSLTSSIGFIFLETLSVITSLELGASAAASLTEPAVPASASKLFSAIFLNFS